MKPKKQTYMVAIQRKITLYPVIYFETIAKNSKEAIKEARDYAKKSLKSSDFLEEAKEDLEYSEFDSSAERYINCGPASQYHSELKCKLCAKVLKDSKPKKRRKAPKS